MRLLQWVLIHAACDSWLQHGNGNVALLFPLRDLDSHLKALESSESPEGCLWLELSSVLHSIAESGNKFTFPGNSFSHPSNASVG